MKVMGLVVLVLGLLLWWWWLLLLLKGQRPRVPGARIVGELEEGLGAEVVAGHCCCLC